MLWLVSACQTDQEQLTVTSLSLASGDFKNLSWGGAQVERFHVVARKVETDEVVIWSADHPKTCSLGDVAWYSSARPMRSGGLAWGALGKGLVPFIKERDQDGRGTLQFAAVDCAVEEFEMPGITPRALFATYDETRTRPTFIAATADARLAFLDPWTGKKIERGENLSGVFPLVEGVWTIENGEAVLRNIDGTELVRTGRSVSELHVLSQGKIALVDDDGLSLFSITSGREPITTDACSPFVPSGFAAGTLAYFSPCDARRLVLRSDAHKVRVEQDAIESVVSDSGSMLYTRKNGDEFELWILNEGDARGGHLITKLRDFDLRDAWLRGPSRFLLWVAQPKASPDNPDGFALYDLDAAKATLEPFLHDLRSIRLEGSLFATLANDGTLELRRLRDLAAVLREHGLRADPRFMFGDTSAALGYIPNVADDDGGVGQLTLFFVHTGERLTVPHAARVREFQEVWWPETGIVYATGAEDPQLRFARVDVPCDQTGASPFQCAF